MIQRRDSAARIAVLLSLLTAMFSWSISSPPLATPDERVHLSSIWCSPVSIHQTCVDREFDSQSWVTTGSPRYRPAHCYFRKSFLPASCVESEPYSEQVQVLREGTYYLAGFQNVMNLFVGTNGEVSTFRIRTFNGLLFAVVMLTVFFYGSRQLATSVLYGVALTMVPFALWLIASPNPSSWSITGVFGFWASLVWLVEQFRQRAFSRSRAQLFRPVFVGSTSLLMAGTSRIDSLIMIGIVLVVTLAIDSQKRLSCRGRTVAVMLMIPLVGISFMKITSSVAKRREILGDLTPVDLSSQPDGWTWASNWLTHFPAVFLDAYGVQGLGENDIRIPSYVFVTTIFVLGASLAFASIKSSRGQLVTAVLLLFSFVCMLWFASFEMDLYNVPGRYVMPLFPVIVGTYIYYSRSEPQFFDVLRLRHIAIGMLGIANAVSLYAVVERYSAGSSAGLRVIPVRFDEWWWDFLPIGPNGVVVIGSVSWVVFLVYAFRLLDQRKLQEANA